MILTVGSKVVISHRRLFNEDQPRIFAGTVDGYEAGIVKVTGYTWVRDVTEGFTRKVDQRTKIVAIASGTMIFYEIPRSVAIESLEIEQDGKRALVLTDGQDFRMDLSEHPRVELH